jgi:16S rRNA (guanine527-N7)-methyltransferase
VTALRDGYPWEAAIDERSRKAGLVLSADAVAGLAAHARAVLEANDRLHLTTVTEPGEFVERHIGESLDGAPLIGGAAHGIVVDLGSGNGYPGIPLAVASGLRPVLVEATGKKASFLKEALAAAGCRGEVLARHVTRATDLDDVPVIAVLATRAMGDWARIVPKLASKLGPGGIILLWTTSDAERIVQRAAWKRLRVTGTRPLPGRDRSLIFRLEQAINI